MKPPIHASRPLWRQQRGLSILTAIFMLVLFGMLAAFMVSMTNTSNITSAQDIQGSRAYHAAHAGFEWGLSQTPTCAAPAALPGPIGEFTVVVGCTAFGPYDEAGDRFCLYRVTATASTGAAVGSPGFIERQVRGSITRDRAGLNTCS